MTKPNSLAPQAGPRNTAVTVELSEHLAPTEFAGLPQALSALWRFMKALPLAAFQAECFKYFLTRPDAAGRTLGFLRRDGHLTLSFSLPDGSHELHVRLVKPALGHEHEPSQRYAAAG